MADVTALGTQFMRDIQMKKQNSGSQWTWERYVKGPLSASDADDISRIAGCWCYDNEASEVRFYANQNHPRWR